MMSYQFPEELLFSSKDERKQYFRNYTVAHPFLVDAYNRAKEAVSNCERESIVIISGPSGVGKSTLLTKVKNDLEQEFLKLDEEKRIGKIPVVRVELSATDQGGFKWTQYYKEMLEAMQECLVNRKVQYEEYYEKTDSGKLVLKSRTTAADYSKVLEKTLINRGVGVVLLDEAQHLAKRTAGRTLLNQLDVIKSLANKSQSLYILAGTYELLDFFDLSAQLSNRTIPIHFPRYRYQNPYEKEAFISTLINLESKMPLKECPKLHENWEFIYERTIGCVGTMKKLLSRAYNFALEGNRSTVTIEMVKKAALSVAQCERMAVEAKEGEETINKAGSSEHLRALLGFKENKESSDKKKNDLLDGEGKENKNRKPWQRNPNRDIIGQANNNT